MKDKARITKVNLPERLERLGKLANKRNSGIIFRDPVFTILFDNKGKAQIDGCTGKFMAWVYPDGRAMVAESPFLGFRSNKKVKSEAIEHHYGETLDRWIADKLQNC